MAVKSTTRSSKSTNKKTAKPTVTKKSRKKTKVATVAAATARKKTTRVLLHTIVSSVCHRHGIILSPAKVIEITKDIAQSIVSETEKGKTVAQINFGTFSYKFYPGRKFSDFNNEVKKCDSKQRMIFKPSKNVQIHENTTLWKP